MRSARSIGGTAIPEEEEIEEQYLSSNSNTYEDLP